jgi:hypothetical protein
MNADRFGKRYSITVCMDGHVSILDTAEKTKQCRLGSALPVFTVDNIVEAFELVRRLCSLSRCHHGGKTGTLLEPRVNGWPNDATLEDLDRVGSLFEAEYEKMRGAT